MDTIQLVSVHEKSVYDGWLRLRGKAVVELLVQFLALPVMSKVPLVTLAHTHGYTVVGW